MRLGVVPRRQKLEIVGVASDARIYNLKDPNVAALYAPALQEPDASYKCFVIRANGVSLAELNRAVDSLGREHIGSMRSIEYITSEILLQERLTAGLAAFFGGRHPARSGHTARRPASLLVIAIAASMLPAARAAGVDPMVALRME